MADRSSFHVQAVFFGHLESIQNGIVHSGDNLTGLLSVGGGLGFWFGGAFFFLGHRFVGRADQLVSLKIVVFWSFE